MKIAGKKVDAKHIEVVVFPRAGGDIVIKAQPIVDEGEFDKVLPPPIPPSIMRPGGQSGVDFEDSKYKKAISDWSAKKLDWCILKSLQATDGLEFETVDWTKPETFGNYLTELKEAGFSVMEVNKIMEIVLEALGLNTKKIDEATKSFLAGQAVTQSE